MSGAAPRGFILVVDDSVSDRDMLSRRLQRRGWTTMTAGSGEDALKLIARQEFDLVLLDVTMPGMDGLSVLAEVRKSRSMADLPVLVVTARDSSSDITRGFQLGANDYITKPLDFPVVLGRVQTQLELKKLTAELRAAQARAKRELETAYRSHRSLIPRMHPALPHVRFSWGFRQCEDLAGDTLDFAQLDERHVGCYLLDVNGRGVQAALLALTLSRLLSRMPPDGLLMKRTAARAIEIVPPATVARILNRRFMADDDTSPYFTLQYGILDAQQRNFRYISAGYPGILHLPSGGLPVLLPSGGPPIGSFKEGIYDESVIQLQSGDRLYVYSDGLGSACNPSGNSFSERFLTLIDQTRDESLEQSIAILFYELTEWCGQMPPQDDVSILALEIDK